MSHIETPDVEIVVLIPCDAPNSWADSDLRVLLDALKAVKREPSTASAVTMAEDTHAEKTE